MNTDILPLNKILLPIDGSEPCRKALTFAGCLTASLGGRTGNVGLLHVLAGSYLYTHMANIDARVSHILESDQFRELKDKHIASSVDPIITEAEAEIRRMGSDTPVERLVVDGDPAEQIVKTGIDGGYSTVIMGRRGRSQLSDILLGSVTSSVLHHSHPMSVYVVGRKIAADNGSCLLPRILVPVDGSPNSMAAVHEAKVLGRYCGEGLDKIILLHVIDLARYSEMMDRKEDPETEGAKILEEAQAILLTDGIDQARIETVAAYGRPAEVIIRTASERDITLLLMSRVGRSALKDLLLGGVSNEILYRCQEPTVAVVCGENG